MKAFVLTGEGIECEAESLRLCQSLQLFSKTSYWPMAAVLKKQGFDQICSGDWVILPGGFSYADHFGSGKLLAHALKKASFFETLIMRGAHILGICNGFQTLVAAGLFGSKTTLKANRVHDTNLGFVNRWVRLKLHGRPQPIMMPVRHGEGRLDFDLSQGASPFLFYDDPFFDNGSKDQVAGLRSLHGQSKVVGLMPHPEVARRRIDSPLREGPDFLVEQRARVFDLSGDGVALAMNIFKE